MKLQKIIKRIKDYWDRVSDCSKVREAARGAMLAEMPEPADNSDAEARTKYLHERIEVFHAVSKKCQCAGCDRGFFLNGLRPLCAHQEALKAVEKSTN